MQVIKTISELNNWHANNPGSKGFVPTMGNLHVGHQSLIERACAENQFGLLSIFVNPTQFNQAQDFEKYPRTIEQDLKMAEQSGVSMVFLPEDKEIYFDQYQFKITENTAENTRMEGIFRPGHFTGMLTVVMKLLQLMRPNKAYFGEKDFQQLQLVRQMVQAFFLPMEIVACESVRLPSKLPYSSRNQRLSEQGLKLANQFAAIIRKPIALSSMIDELSALSIRVDYLEDIADRRFAAVWVDDVRLIDNFKITGE